MIKNQLLNYGYTKPRKHNKRPLPETTELRLEKQKKKIQESHNQWPKYIIMTATKNGENHHELFLFAIQKAIQNLLGDPRPLEVLRNGFILILEHCD